MLECLGYLVDNNINTFSLVFALPVLPSDASTKEICTLKHKLDDRTYQPALEQRFELARSVCTSILRLHCWGWIHKDIRSENILLVPHEDGGFNAYLCGFDVARHESDSSDLATVMDPERNFYRHPHRQQQPQRKATKLDDLYATGVVLMEIGLTKTVGSLIAPKIQDIMTQNRRAVPPAEIAKKLVNYAVDYLPARMGSRYADAVRRCLQWDFGVEYDDEAKTELSIAFQEMVLETVEDGCRL
jgi:serine/threonine protein kinase